MVKTIVSEDLKIEMKKNSEIFSSNLNLQPSDTTLFINGLFYDIDLVDMYGILEILRQELSVMEGLHDIGISNKRLSSLLALDFGDSSSGSQEFAMDIRDSAVNWINNIEDDSKYRRWSSNLMELLRPTFPGMLRQVRRNLFNLVRIFLNVMIFNFDSIFFKILVINPTDPEVRGILKLVESFVVHSAPLRVGIVLSVDSSSSLTGLDDVGVAILCGFNYAMQNKDPIAALSFLHQVSTISFYILS